MITDGYTAAPFAAAAAADAPQNLLTAAFASCTAFLSPGAAQASTNKPHSLARKTYRNQIVQSPPLFCKSRMPMIMFVNIGWR